MTAPHRGIRLAGRALALALTLALCALPALAGQAWAAGAPPAPAGGAGPGIGAGQGVPAVPPRALGAPVLSRPFAPLPAGVRLRPARWTQLTRTGATRPDGLEPHDGLSDDSAGYLDQGTTFSEIAADWTVPQIPASGNETGVGDVLQIDGLAGENSILSVGVQADAQQNQVEDVAYYQDDTDQEPITLVEPGDQMTASLDETSAGEWNVTFDDVTEQEGFSQPVDYSGPDSTIQWTAQTFTDNSVPVPLASFGTTAFSGLQLAGSDTSAASAEPVFMVDSSNDVIAYPGNLSDAAFTVTAGTPQPNITGVSPSSGYTTGGTSVTIAGPYLIGPQSVDFGSVPATIVSGPGAASVVVTSPPHAAGAVTVSVTTAGGTAIDIESFTYVLPPPTVASLTPDVGSTAGLTAVTLTGRNLSGATSVLFGSGPASVTADSATSLTVITPAGPAGTVDVTVTTAGGTGMLDGAFTYFVPPPPTISGVSPATGPTAGGTEVTLTGTNVESVTAVQFGPTAGTVYADPDDGDSVVVVSPAGSAGAPVSITLTTAGGSVTDTGVFSYIAAVGDPYTPLVPTRICDTRAGNPSGLSGDAAQCAGKTLAPGQPLSIAVAGEFGVPADATAAVFNVTAISSASSGYVSVYPADQVPPTASNLNYPAGRAVPNLVETGLGASGEISLLSNATTDVIVDLEGYVGPGATSGAGLYNPLASPARICDTRTGNPSGLSGGDLQCEGHAPGTGGTLVVQVTGNGGVPDTGVAAVVLNVTAVSPSAQGYLSAYATGGTAPTASNVNYLSGQTVSNRVVVPVSAAGDVSLYASRATNVIVDVSGWYSAAGGTGAQFVPLAAPVRICDTRAGNPSGLAGGATQCDGDTRSAGSVLTVSVPGPAGIPADTTSVVLNVTAIHPSAQTYLTVYPADPRPTVSDLNPSAGSVKANLVVASLSGSGTFDLFNYAGQVDVAVDVAGYFE